MQEERLSPLQKKLVSIRRDAEERDAERRAARQGTAYVNLSKIPVVIEALRLIPEAVAHEAKVAAIEYKNHELAIAAFDSESMLVQKVKKDLEAKHYTLKFFTVSLSSLAEAWRFYSFVSGGKDEITGKMQIREHRFEELLQKLGNFEAVAEAVHSIDPNKITTTDLFEIFISGALASRASDIHFEAEEHEAKVRYRLDGALHDVFLGLDKRHYESLVSRIKLLAGLKINVYSEAQDGRFSINLPGKEIEVRVSSIPSDFGETIVMRVLDPDAIKVDLQGLGLRDDDVELVTRELSRPNGLILNTGPTGSGKTTTLYAFLRQITNPEIKVITIEDPIEYRVEGIEQTQVDPEAHYTFATGLRAILRQDPDIILVGEIRDLETADIAMQASLTGHMVFSTLHTNSAIGAIPRLVDLGVKPQTIGPAVTLVIAQRLLRRLCDKCKRPITFSPEMEQRVKSFVSALPEKVNKTKYQNIFLFEAVGCSACNNIGYKGRFGIYEFLTGGIDFEEVIVKDSSEVALRQLAKKQGVVGMQTDGLLKVISGLTTMKELESVTGPMDWK